MRLYPKEIDTRTASPLTLAYIGDAVYELMVRERLVCLANRPAGALHNLSVQAVRAEAQSAAVERLLPVLTEAEMSIYKRGRNAHTTRNSTEYHRATGLEALFGYLYLNNHIDRLRQLFELAVDTE